MALLFCFFVKEGDADLGCLIIVQASILFGWVGGWGGGGVGVGGWGCSWDLSSRICVRTLLTIPTSCYLSSHQESCPIES